MTAQERWGRHVAAWASSGLSCKDYAAEAGVNPRTLTWWKSKLRGAGDAGPAAAPSFVEVNEQLAATAPPSSVIELDVVDQERRVPCEAQREGTTGRTESDFPNNEPELCRLLNHPS
jgi:hypothetical protein